MMRPTVTNALRVNVASLIGLATVFITASKTQALEVGCQPAQDVKAQLASEGQFVLVTGERATDTFPTNRFTSNARGTLGYQIEDGKLTAEGLWCVKTKYTDIKVNDNPALDRPSWATFGSVNSSYNLWLSGQEARYNEKILLGATTVVRLSPTREVKGAYIVVTMGDKPTTIRNPRFYNGGGVHITDATGNKSTLLGGLANVSKTQPNYDMFAKGSH